MSPVFAPGRVKVRPIRENNFKQSQELDMKAFKIHVLKTIPRAHRGEVGCLIDHRAELPLFIYVYIARNDPQVVKYNKLVAKRIRRRN